MTKLLFVLLAIGFVDKCRGANISYNFEEETTETVLASLELSSLPATHTEIVGLMFTVEGQEIFGYGSEYLGTFDLTISQIIDDGSGGLRFGLIHDNDPVDSTFHEIFGTFRVALSFNHSLGFPDSISVLPFEPRQVEAIFRKGNWRLVPEPPDLRLVIEALIDDGVLNRGQGNSLLVKLNFNSNQQAAPNRIEALINQINAFVNAGILTSVEGELLIDGAESLRDNLSVTGDFDADGDLDGADFLKWQRNDGSTAGLTLWEDNYGTNASSTSAAIQNIPEPSSFALIMLCSCSLLSRRQLSRF